MAEQFDFLKPSEDDTKKVESHEEERQPTDAEIREAFGEAGKSIDPQSAARQSKKAFKQFKADMIRLYQDPFMFDKDPTNKPGEQKKMFKSEQK